MEITAQHVNGPSLALQVACRGGGSVLPDTSPEPASLLTTGGGSNAGPSLPWRLMSRGGGGEMPRGASSQTQAAQAPPAVTPECAGGGPGPPGALSQTRGESNTQQATQLPLGQPHGTAWRVWAGSGLRPEQLMLWSPCRGAEWPGCPGQSLALPFPGLTRVAASCPWA